MLPVAPDNPIRILATASDDRMLEAIARRSLCLRFSPAKPENAVETFSRARLSGTSVPFPTVNRIRDARTRSRISDLQAVSSASRRGTAAHIIINCEHSETTLGNDFPLRHREAYPEAKSSA